MIHQEKHREKSESVKASVLYKPLKKNESIRTERRKHK